MAKAQQSRRGAPRRRTAPARVKRIILRPGHRLITPSVTVIARQKNTTTEVTCKCTKSTPDRPDCKPKVTTVGNTVRVQCVKSGGCTSCQDTTVVTTKTTM